MRANEKAPMSVGALTGAVNQNPAGADSHTSISDTGSESLFIRIPEMMELMDCSRSTAQRCAASINARLKAEGKFTIAGRVNRKAFYEAVGYRSM